jgi:hypothetical protein
MEIRAREGGGWRDAGTVTSYIAKEGGKPSPRALSGSVARFRWS